MKITPLEIRQKDFEKKLRGYDKDEVNAFLQSLSNEWERMLEENKELTLKLQQSEKEVSKLREVESSLFKTLKTAEDTGANVIDQANKAAELHMKETKMNSEALLNESKNKARAMIEQAEMEARQIIEELQDAVKSIEQNHRDIENHRQNAIQELKNLSVTLIEKVEKNTEETREFRFDDYVKRVKKLARESEERLMAEKVEVSDESKLDVLQEEQPKPKPIEKPQSVELKPSPSPEPPKSDEFPKRIIKQRPIEEKIEEESEIEPVNKVEPSTEELTHTIKQEETAEAVESVATEKVEKIEKKGPRISKTVSFFDELDTDS